jgi:hypothetical protein
MLINKEYTFKNYCFIIGFRQVFRFPKGFRHQKRLRTAVLEYSQNPFEKKSRDSVNGIPNCKGIFKKQLKCP